MKITSQATMGRIIMILSVPLIFMVSYLLIQSWINLNNEVDFGNSIDERLNILVSPKTVMSNPNEYIKRNKPVYDSIVAEGRPALSYLLKELKVSKEDGLKAWIMAKLCCDILKEKNPVFHWSTGKEWYFMYVKDGAKNEKDM
jgi:hypothetical protein